MIKIESIYEKGKIEGYTVGGTGIPTMKFATDEEAHVVTAIIKLLKSQNIEFDICYIKCIFRLLGIKSVWTE